MTKKLIKGKKGRPNLRVHRDYRIVLNDVWMQALARGKVEITQRDVFEDLIHEHPVACLIRALGAYETGYHNKYNFLATEGMDGAAWLNMWQQVRVLLSSNMRDPLDGATLWNCLFALGLNAGFTEKELA